MSGKHGHEADHDAGTQSSVLLGLTSERLAWQLSLAGYFPFIALALLALILGSGHGLFPPILESFKTYSAIILSFMGGVRWGAAIKIETPSRMVLMASVLPALVGWFVLFFPDNYAILILLLAFCAQGAWDSMAANSSALPRWFGNLRIILTLLVAAAHIIMFAALF